MERLLSYDYIYLIPLTISAIVGVRSFRLKWSLAFKIFSAFLVLTLTLEGIAIAWKWGLNKTQYWDYSQSNMWIYNAFIAVRLFFTVIFYYHLFTVTTLKKVIPWLTVLFLVFAIINYGALQSPYNVNTHTIIIANTFTICLVLIFFRQILNEERIITLSSSTEVWISIGSFIYYSGTLPFFIFFNYLIKIHSPLVSSYLYINDFLNVIMYTLYSIAFLCRPQFQK